MSTFQVRLDADTEHFFTDEGLECTCEPVNACMGRCKALTRCLSSACLYNWWIEVKTLAQQEHWLKLTS